MATNGGATVDRGSDTGGGGETSLVLHSRTRIQLLSTTDDTRDLLVLLNHNNNIRSLNEEKCEF